METKYDKERLNELKDIYTINLIDFLGANASMIIDEHGINKDSLKEIIRINENKLVLEELKKYINIKQTISDMKEYIVNNKYALKQFISLDAYRATLIIYKCLIEKYYSLKKEYEIVNNKKLEITNKLTKYDNCFISSVFSKKNELKNKLKVLNSKSMKIKQGISNTKREINELISKIDNEEIRYLFDYNRDIVLTLDYLAKKSNPFIDDKLDVTLNYAVKSKRKADLIYFLGSNLHNIDENYLKEYVKYLEVMLNRYKKIITEKLRELGVYFSTMSNDSKNTIENNYSMAYLVVYLNENKDKYGMCPIDYVYALDEINSGKEISNDYVNSFISKLAEISNKNKKVLVKRAN